MGMNGFEIVVEAEDPNWKQRCSDKMEALKKQFADPDQDDAANAQLNPQEKELFEKKQVKISELYKAVQSEKVDHFVQVLERVCDEKKLPLTAVFTQVANAGDSMLHVAAHWGKEQVAELICESFPELLTWKNARGDSALHVAVRSEKSSAVKVILAQMSKHNNGVKALTRLRNAHGDTPLHEAVNSGNLEIVEDVLRVDDTVVHDLNESNKSPLYLAVVSRNVEILKLLLRIPLLTLHPLPQLFGNSPLHAAIMERNSGHIEEILKEKPELIYLKDEDGCTPLHYAAYIGYAEGFRILLKKSLEEAEHIVMEPNKKGYLPIHLACKRDHVKVVNEFFKYEWPNLNVLLTKKSQNILHVAAKNGKEEVVKYLLKNRQVDEFLINEKDKDGNTPLHLASINLFPKVLYFMTRDKRTKGNLTNNKGLTARDIVRLANKSQISSRKFVANLVLKDADVSVRVVDMLRSQYKQRNMAPKKENKNSSDLLNTFLVVATLIVTVTFAAAFTPPGGVYGPDDPDPEKRGVAVLAHKPLFWVFTTFNMTAMYSSVTACGLLLLAMVFDHKLALRASILALMSLVLAFLLIPVILLAAVRLVVANNYALGNVITAIAALYIFIILMGLYFVLFPIGIRFPLLRQMGRLNLRIIIALIGYDDKPPRSSSKAANKQKNDKENKEE